MIAEPTAQPPSRPDLDAFRGDRIYLGADHRRNEARTWVVAAICAVTLVIQVAGGLAFHSMALVASGLHMAAHVAVLIAAAGAYALARRHADNPRFAFGTGKIGYLAGFANAVILAITAIAIGWESIHRILDPQAVHYHGALPLASAGLALTLICAFVLRPSHTHASRHDRDGDLNMSAIHLHLTADAVSAGLAIAAMLLGSWLGWDWADPAAGLVGAVLVARFAWTLLRRTSAPLLDINPSPELTAEVRRRLEAGGGRVADLHLWRLGPGHHAAVAVVAGTTQTADDLRARLTDLPGLSHVTLEVHATAGDHCGHAH